MTNNAQIVEGRTTGRHPLPGDGAMPVSALHFRTGRVDEARTLVLQHHYSGRCATNLRFVGSLHEDGGLFGGDGPMVAAALWYTPGTPWKEDVLELGRLVRGERRVPLTFLVSRCTKELRRQGHDLLVSYADSTQGHEGYVYRACNWRYHGKPRPPGAPGGSPITHAHRRNSGLEFRDKPCLVNAASTLRVVSEGAGEQS